MVRRMACLTLLAFIAGLATAQIPKMISYQGVLTDLEGNPVADGTYSLTFRLYEQAEGGTAVWEETHASVTVTDGVFGVLLGSVKPLALSFERPYWLGLAVDGEAELTPRVALASVPYSLRAAGVAEGGAVQSLNGLRDAVELVAGENVAIEVNGQQIRIAATAGGGMNEAWRLTGNAGTTPGTHFVGTIDEMPLELHVNGARALRLEPGNSPNVIGGHADNAVTAGVVGATIAGGGAPDDGQAAEDFNTVTGNYGTVGGGQGNQAGLYATVGGGQNNSANGLKAVVGGGHQNVADGWYASIGGGSNNQAAAQSATVSGGAQNTASAELAFVGGGVYNVASGSRAVVSGRQENIASGTGAFVGGGGYYVDGNAFVGGNRASAPVSTVAGGFSNVIAESGKFATVSGGRENTASGEGATIPGGAFNVAAGNYSLAAGRRARAEHAGTFVWADAVDEDFVSTAENQFLVRATGGVRFQGGNKWNLDNTEGDVRIGNDTFRFKIGVALGGAGAGDVWFRAHGGTGRMFFWTKGVTIYTNDDKTTGVVLPANSGSWSSVSDRHVKVNVVPVDPQVILTKVAALPISTWSYVGQPEAVRHMGPMAQDFYAAFGLGESDTHIAVVDADGVALAAIQGLYQQVRELEVENARQQAKLEQLAAEVARLQTLVKSLLQEKAATTY